MLFYEKIKIMKPREGASRLNFDKKDSVIGF